MYRQILLTFMVCCSLAATAQSWTMVNPRQFNDETIVYATISNESGLMPAQWMLAAFIDGECRGEVREPSVGPDDSQLFVLRIYGDRDSDKGKPVSFAVCHQTTLHEYTCESSEPVTFTGESFGHPSSPVRLTFSSVDIPLQGFIVSVGPWVAGQTAQLRLTPVPANAKVWYHELSVAITGVDDLSPWNTLTCEEASREPIIYNITSTIPRQYQLTVNNLPLFAADGQTPFTGLEAVAPLSFNKGWQWRTNTYGDVTTADFERVYGGNALTEIRTEEYLLYNDPAWGYFGTLVGAGLPQDMPYKVRMASDLNTTLAKGHYVAGYSLTVSDGWTWIPSPYYFDRQISAVFNPSQLPVGMVIISKEQGSAEWNGEQWVGDLKVLPANESFLCYAGTEAPFTLTYRPEAEMAQGNDQPQAAAPEAAPALARRNDTSPWHYDASRFRDNMTMVIQLPQLAQPADYSLGAFVGDECRGEGRYVTGGNAGDGYFFTTVHCNQGERISFRLCHQASGRQYAVDQTVTSTGLRLGSLRQPLPFTSHEQVTAIGDSPSATTAPHVMQTYDLTGRKVQSTRRGLLIQQLSDGSVRRIIR